MGVAAPDAAEARAEPTVEPLAASGRDSFDRLSRIGDDAPPDAPSTLDALLLQGTVLLLLAVAATLAALLLAVAAALMAVAGAPQSGHFQRGCDVAFASST